MSKIIRTSKPSVLPWYAAALVFVVLCAVLPVYQLWALLARQKKSARPAWWNTKCPSTPAWTMWTLCSPGCRSSWIPSTL